MVFAGALWPFILVGALLSTFLSLGLILIDRKTDAPTPRDISPAAGVAALLGAALARISLMYLLTRTGFELLCTDESCRFMMAVNWADAPYPITHNGVWLTGNFFIFGNLARWFDSAAMALHVGVLASHLLTIGAAYLAAWSLSGRHWIGAACAWMTAITFTFLWVGTGTLVEGFMAAFFMLGLAAAWRYLQTPRDRPGRQWLWAAGAGAAFFLVTTQHYTGWMALAVLMPLLLVGVWLRRRELGPGGVGASALMIAGTAVFPMLWVYWSWRHLGSPLAFLRNQSAVNQSYQFHTVFGLDSPRWAYLRCFVVQSGMLAPLALAAIGSRERNYGARRHGARRLLLLFVVLLLALMTWSTFFGGMAAGVFRNNVLVTAGMTIVAALALEPLGALPGSGRARSWARLALGGLAGALLVTWFSFNVLMGNRYETEVFGHIDHSTMALGAWMQQEVRRPDMLKDFGPETRIGFFREHFGVEHRDYVAYKAGCPRRLVALDAGQLERAEFAGLHYLISERPVAAAGWQPFMQMTPYTLYRRAAAQP